jgi:excisionase family DNA binding protein
MTSIIKEKLRRGNKKKRSALVTISSAAEILGVSQKTLRSWDKSGKLKAQRYKRSGYRLYGISELESFANQQGFRRKTAGRLLKDVGK